jgi:hypothetical protein
LQWNVLRETEASEGGVTMKVQRYVAWASVAILSLSAQNALANRAERPSSDILTRLREGFSHVFGGGSGLPTTGRPGAPTDEEPRTYSDLIKTLEGAPGASAFRVKDGIVLKKRGEQDTETKAVEVTRANVDKLNVWTKYYQQYRKGLSDCAEHNDRSATAIRALLDDYVAYLEAALGKEENIVLNVNGQRKKATPLDERVILAYRHAFKQVFDKKKSAFSELRGEHDAGDKQLLQFVDRTAEALFGRDWQDTYTDAKFRDDAAKDAPTAIDGVALPEGFPPTALEGRAPLKMKRIATLTDEAVAAIDQRAADTGAVVCRPVPNPAPPSGSGSGAGSNSGESSSTGSKPSGAATPKPTPKPTGTLPSPAPIGDGTGGSPGPTPAPTQSPTQSPTGGVPSPTQPPLGQVPPPGQDTFLNPFNNQFFDPFAAQLDAQNRALLDLLRQAQDAANRAALDAQRAIQDANNRDNNAADALRAAINGKGDDGRQQQPFFPPQSPVIPAETGSEGPQFEPIATPPFGEQPPPSQVPMPFFIPPPPPPPASSTASNGPERPLFEESPRPMFFGPPMNPQASAALELARFNMQVMQQAQMAGLQQRGAGGAGSGRTVGDRLQMARPPRRLTPGTAGVPARYQAPGGVGPTVVRRAANGAARR